VATEIPNKRGPEDQKAQVNLTFFNGDAQGCGFSQKGSFFLKFAHRTLRRPHLGRGGGE
jgi:hypothetical protein